MTRILSGKIVADEIRQELSQKILKLTDSPALAVILVGDNPSSQTYVGVKSKAAESVGIHSIVHRLAASISEKELLYLIQTLNHDPKINGILVQLPLPPHLNSSKITESIDPNKDVDGLHPLNMGKLLLGSQEGFIPCTPLGIKTLLERSNIPVEGKHVVIAGRSNIVGKPLAALWVQNQPGCQATVTIIHSKTRGFNDFCRSADILVAAIGSPRFIKAEMVKEGAVVIDVGINRELDPQHPSGSRIVGDVDFDAVAKKCSAITPVPKGVGPMTVAMLLSNTLSSYQRYRT